MCDALEHGHECVFIAVRKYFFNEFLVKINQPHNAHLVQFFVY